MTGSQRLTFDGDLELIDVGSDEAEGFTIEAVAGTRFGNPVPVESVIASFLRDGSIVSKTGDENREMSVLVQVRGTDGIALALGEKRLNLATGKRTTIAWTPPDGFGPMTVFDVLTSSLERVEDDEWDADEALRGVRTYTLRLVCLPFGRSAELVVDDAGTPPSSGGTLVYNGESTSGWAAFDQGSAGGDWVAPAYSVDAAVFVQGTGSVKSLMTQWEEGRVYAVGNGAGGYLSPANGYSRDQITGLNQSTGTGGYLSVNIRGEAANTTTLTRLWMSTAPGQWSEVASFGAFGRDASGFVSYVWPVAADLTVLGLRFQVQQRRQADNVPRPHTWYDKFELLASATTDKQIVKQLEVKGSARTTGSLRISAGADAVALGHVLAITAPTDELPPGFQPDARRWVAQGTTTADSAALRGSYYTPSTSSYDSGAGKPVFDVPVGSLTPGPYSIVALVKAEGSTTVAGVQAQLRVGSTNVGPTSTAEVSLPNLVAGWQFVTVGTVFLPPLAMAFADTTAKARLLFKGAKLAEVYLIPAWQVGGRAVADYSIVNCGGGGASADGSSSSLWIDSPSVEQPRGGYWRGPTPDRVNARSAWPDAKRLGVHSFRPGALSAFVVSTDAQGPALELSYFPSWFGNAAQ